MRSGTRYITLKRSFPQRFVLVKSTAKGTPMKRDTQVVPVASSILLLNKAIYRLSKKRKKGDKGSSDTKGVIIMKKIGNNTMRKKMMTNEYISLDEFILPYKKTFTESCGLV